MRSSIVATGVDPVKGKTGGERACFAAGRRGADEVLRIRQVCRWIALWTHRNLVPSPLGVRHTSEAMRGPARELKGTGSQKAMDGVADERSRGEFGAILIR